MTMHSAIKRLLGALIVACAVTTASAESTTVTADRVNLRSQPSTNSRIVATVTRGAVLQVQAREGDWYRVSVPGTGEAAYVHSVLVEASRTAASVPGVVRHPSGPPSQPMPPPAVRAGSGGGAKVPLLIGAAALAGGAVVVASKLGDDHPATPNLSGSWRGTWQSAEGPGGLVTANLNHAGTALTGTASVAESPCFASGAVSGSVSGGSVTIGIAFPGSQQVNFVGAVDAGESMSGQYSVTGGRCTGDAGSWLLTRH